MAKAISDEANERIESKSKKKAKARAQRGLRSDGSVEEELGTDSLIVRMGKILEPMKDAFIVAYLQPRIFACAMGIRHKKELNNSNQHGAEIQRAPSNLRVGQTKPNSTGVDKQVNRPPKQISTTLKLEIRESIESDTLMRPKIRMKLLNLNFMTQGSNF